MELQELLPIGAAIVSFIVAAGFAAWVSKQQAGTKEMVDISNAVKTGASAFLKREMKIIIPIAIALSIIIGLFLQLSNGIAFAVGAGLSAVAGIISLKITVKAAVRSANATQIGLGKTFALAFRGGATVGLAVPAMALLAITLLYLVYPNPITIAGVGIGASLIALFIRIGGGIFTKDADMAADLVGKVEANIPEDDPRNPATIADNVGDNVGDAAGMGSDVYESYIVTILASILIAALIGSPENFLYPILIGASGMIASIIGAASIGTKKITDVMKPLTRAFFISAGVAIAYSASPDPSQALLYGIFGTSLTAMAMLSLAGIVLSIDAFGPIADNAGGIVEMTGMGEENRKITDEIDAVGNNTKAVTKGFAIASAGLAALAMIQAFQFEAAHTFETVFDYSLSNVTLIVGLLVGGLIPFIITGQLINGVSRAASKLVDEVRRQFKNDPEILTGKSKPDYAKCVDIATVASVKELWKSASIAIAAPIILGIILGPPSVVGLLMGAVVTGIPLAYHLANTGGAWDNAKKLIEVKGQKGTEEHKVAVVGDIIGDPYKDTAGPALNTVIKLLNTIAIVFVPIFVGLIVLGR